MNARFSRTLLVSVGVSLLTVMGCAPGLKPMPKRSLTAPPVVYCHDGVGHISGHKPWILGGNCCCTPTEARFSSYRAERTVPDNMTYQQFRDLFKQRGVVTDLDADYKGSNCGPTELGAHVVFGGKCMVTPTPGTRLYEEVTAGQRFLLPKEGE